jgi:hypothetical protein
VARIVVLVAVAPFDKILCVLMRGFRTCSDGSVSRLRRHKFRPTLRKSSTHEFGTGPCNKDLPRASNLAFEAGVCRTPPRAQRKRKMHPGGKQWLKQ